MIHYDIYYNIIMQAIISFQFCTNQNIVCVLGRSLARSCVMLKYRAEFVCSDTWTAL